MSVVNSQRTLATVDDASKAGRTVTAKINTSCVDRYRTVILPAGGDFRNFMGTPAVLWEHGQDPTRGRQAIGACSSIRFRKAEDDIIAVTRFKSDDYSDRIFNDYIEGTLTAFSIDFMPDMTKSSRPTPEELRARPDWDGAECIFRSWEMTGFSGVSYPGNPEALAIAVQRGLWVPDEVRKSLQPPHRDMVEGGGAAGGYATETKSGRHVCEREGLWCVMEGEECISRHETEAEANAACNRAEPDEAEDTGAEVDEDVVRTTPPLPAGVRVYTVEELIGITAATLVPHILALTEQSIRDAHDLARGRV